MYRSVAEALPGDNWQVEGLNWVSIASRQDGCIVIFNDEGICEYSGDALEILWDFLEDKSLDGNSVILNGGPLPDVKPDNIIRWDLGAMPGKEAEQPSVRSELEVPKAKVVISHIQYDGAESRTEADEYVEITNQGGIAVDISGWQLHGEGEKKVFTFPQGTVVAAAQSIRLYTNQFHQETGGFSFNSKRALWNNRGDAGQLIDNQGNLKSEYKYGNKATT